MARRTNEIGIRKALGAQHSAVMSMILRETGLLLVVGLIAGVALSAMGMQLITSRLYGLPTDPVAFAIAAAVLTGGAGSGVDSRLPGLASRPPGRSTARIR